MIAAGRRRTRSQTRIGVESNDDTRHNPLQLFDALRMAALFQIVLMAVHLANRIWGESGVLTTAAVLGLTDVDALTMSMARGMLALPRWNSLRALLRSVSLPILR